MPLDPTARVVIDAMDANFPALDTTIDGTEMRRRVEAAAAKVIAPATEVEPVEQVVDTTVAGPAGEIAVRIYRQRRRSRARADSGVLPWRRLRAL